jgi:hypothetical protein
MTEAELTAQGISEFEDAEAELTAQGISEFEDALQRMEFRVHLLVDMPINPVERQLGELMGVHVTAMRKEFDGWNEDRRSAE